jgi:uncharacterized RDD family membrane protein YckC
VPLDNTVEVETPEHLHFRYRVAGPMRRMLAYLLDLLIRAVVLLVVGLVLAIALGGTDALSGIMLIILFFLEWGYYVFFETTGDGRSPGKRALSLRVVKEGGYPLGFIDSVLRNLLRGADWLPMFYVVGGFVMAADSRFRRIGDRVAGTLVVVEERSHVAAPLTITPPPTAAELEGFPQRPPLSAWERETLELYLRRVDLTAARREELALIIAPALAQRIGVTVKDPVRFLALLHHRVVASARPKAGGPGPFDRPGVK